jgi:hypothetical protein
VNRRGSIAATWARPGVVRTIVAGLVLAAVIVWLSLPRGADGDVDGAAPARPAVAAVASRIAQSPAQEGVGPESSSSRPSGSELIEVCGLGWVEPDASGAWDTAAAGAVPDVVASQRAVLESIRRSDGDLGAAIATVLELHGGGREDHAAGTASALRCTGSDCASSEHGRQLAAGLLEQLAKQATATLDGRVYALAMKECEAAPAQGSCALLNLEQWARLDDGNAMPWLHLLQRARQRNDAGQIHEALYRIGAAPRFEARLFVAAGSVSDHAGPSDLDVMAAQLLAVDAFMQASARQPSFPALTLVCSGAALADANRRQACDSAAGTLTERSDSLLAVAVGAALGRRLGWPDDRIDSLRGLQLAAEAMVRDGDSTAASAAATDLPSTCGGARRLLALFSRQAHAGEVQPIRDWLAAHGASIAPYAQRAHEILRKRDEAESANVAAAAASAPASAVAMAADGATPYSEAPPPGR